MKKFFLILALALAASAAQADSAAEMREAAAAMRAAAAEMREANALVRDAQREATYNECMRDNAVRKAQAGASGFYTDTSAVCLYNYTRK
jgi:hypothetical protein